MSKIISFDASVTVGNSGTTVLKEVICNGAIEYACFEIANNSAVSLDQVVLQIKAHASASYVDAETAWTTLGDILKFKSATLASMATGVAGTAIVWLGRPYSFRLTASLASSSGLVDVNGTAAGC